MIAAACASAGCVNIAEPAGSNAPFATEPATDPALIALGEEAFRQCRGCHTIGKGDPSSMGPNLYAVVGRKAGSFPGYPYTRALSQSEIVWDEQNLDAYLADPTGYLPGSDMRRGRVGDPAKRAAIIAFLASKGD